MMCIVASLLNVIRITVILKYNLFNRFSICKSLWYTSFVVFRLLHFVLNWRGILAMLELVSPLFSIPTTFGWIVYNCGNIHGD